MTKQLIVEERFSPVKILEAEEGQPSGALRFEAVVSTADFVNRNSRIYPEDVLFPAFVAYNRLIDEGVAQPGLVDHPGMFDGPSLAAVGIKWERFWFEGKDVVGRGSVVMTQRGSDLAALMKAGVSVAFSTRGYGETEEIIGPDGTPVQQMKPGYTLDTVDAVCDPSVFRARVRRVSQEEKELMNELEELKALVEKLTAELAEATEKLAGFAGVEESHQSEVEGLKGTVESLTNEKAGLEAQVAELTAKLEAQETARKEQVEDLEARIAELEAELAKERETATENALTAKLHELTEGHRFAQAIINEARELGVNLETVEKVVGRLTALVEAAGAAANEVAPRGDVSTDEDVPEEPVVEGEKLNAEQLAELLESKLITKAEYEKRMARLG